MKHKKEVKNPEIKKWVKEFNKGNEESVYVEIYGSGMGRIMMLDSEDKKYRLLGTFPSVNDWSNILASYGF